MTWDEMVADGQGLRGTLRVLGGSSPVAKVGVGGLRTIRMEIFLENPFPKVLGS